MTLEKRREKLSVHKKAMNAIIKELRAKRCLRDIAQHWTFRSTVPGPGLRQVSDFLCRRHQEHGVKAEVIPYPADDKTEWLHGHRNPLEWVPRSARLDVVKPETSAHTVCSYSEEPLSLMSNSTSTPAGGINAPVVVMHSGVRDEEYENVDVSGKIIFTDLPASVIEAQARKRGAVGVISDCICPPWLASHPPVREPEDVPDLTMWSILSGRRNEQGLWAFSLSARQGRRLRQIIRESSEPVVLRAEVDADLVEGTSEVVNALLPGTDLAHEEIWVLAHSSEPGARDNASGCCLGVELARALKHLTDTGILPPLRRSIRFLNGVEVQGFLPYIDSRFHELDHVVAGLCLDSVGQDFSICGGELVMFQAPDTNTSFADGLMEYLIAAAAAEPIHLFSSDNYATFPWHSEPYWNNDSFVSHGFFDIPTPQLSTWPDRFYHSSMDTPDQMSDNTLGRVGAVVGTYLYLLATAGPREALWFAGLGAKDWKRRICDVLTEEALKEHTDQIRALAKHLGLQAADAVKQVIRFAPDDDEFCRTVDRVSEDMKQFAANESDRMAALSSAMFHQNVPVKPEAEDHPEFDNRRSTVVKRLRWRTPSDHDFSEDGRAKLSALRERNGKLTRTWDWINGRRTIEEIWERVQFDNAVSYDMVADYLELLIAEGMAVEVH